MYVQYLSVTYLRIVCANSTTSNRKHFKCTKNLHFEIIIRNKNVSLHKINAVGLRQD